MSPTRAPRSPNSRAAARPMPALPPVMTTVSVMRGRLPGVWRMKPFGGPAGGKQGAVTGPEVTALDTAVYVIPTDAPEADGTLAWDRTTMVLVTARAGGEHGIGWSYTAAAAATVVDELLTATVTGR